jgi:hypothetical protein
VTSVINHPRTDVEHASGTEPCPVDPFRPTGNDPDTMETRAAHASPPGSLDDTGTGLAMFVIFTAAALILTGAVALLALVGSWWMLGVAFAVHVAMTAVVTLTIVGAMSGSPYGISTSRRTSPPREPQLGGETRTRSEAVAAL